MKDNIAHFRFYEELNQFLPPDRRKVNFSYRFKGNPAVKDPIEAIGIPHTEVDLVIVNGESVSFAYRLNHSDHVSVYPQFEAFDISPIVKLRELPLRRTSFIADANLGKLSRCLRLLGFDCLYNKDFTDSEVIQTGLKEHRIILTRDRRLLYNRIVSHGCFIFSDDPVKQTKQVIKRFQLENNITPFHRCLQCNGAITEATKSEVIKDILPKTAYYYKKFFRCKSCKKVYWKGPHFEKMLLKIQTIIASDST